MSMVMNYNAASVAGQRIFQKNSLAMKRSLEKLSTGLRTTKSDIGTSAGIAISESMKARVYSLEKAIDNTQDGISLIQTAAGALDTVQNLLTRMRELSLQSVNDSLTQQDKGYIQAEINGIRDEITRIGNNTQFNRKKILSGDSAVLWSSTDSNVRAIVNGGIRSVDSFGQKYSAEGNYRLSVKTDAGKAQIQKTNIFTVKDDVNATQEYVNLDAGVRDVKFMNDVPSGKYYMSLSEAEAADPVVTGSYGFTSGSVSNAFTITAGEGLEENANILFEVTSYERIATLDPELLEDEDYIPEEDDYDISYKVVLKATANIMDQYGQVRTVTMDNIGLELDEEGGNTVDLARLLNANNAMTIGLNEFDSADSFGKGTKFTISVGAQTPHDDAIGIDIASYADSRDPDGEMGSQFGGYDLHYVLDGTLNTNKELLFQNFFLNDRGDVALGTIAITTGDHFKSVDAGGTLDTGESTLLARLNAQHAGKVADGDTKLVNIQQFWDEDGKFVLDQPRALVLTQGDGRQATVTLYGNDTLNDVARKLNDAIAHGLGQIAYVDDASKFVSYVEGAAGSGDAVEGTIVLRSVLPGKAGEITISGNDSLMDALAINTIQQSEDTAYTVSVYDAHDGKEIARNVNVSGNRLVGVIHSNVDIEFDPMMGIKATWDSTTRNFDLAGTPNGAASEAVIHIADNTTMFQTGAKEGEDVIIALGDMRSHALGLDGVNVMNYDNAIASVGIIDRALDKVSMQQASLGSAQIRLEHHMNAIMTESESTQTADSTMRDLDYMDEIMEFAKNEILVDANTAMLAQTNQIQQTTILKLLDYIPD